MATLKLAATAKKIQEEQLGNNQSRDTVFTRNNEDCITLVSKVIERRLTKKLSQQFNRTEIQKLGALYKIDEFF